jgi:hypothetical protein
VDKKASVTMKLTGNVLEVGVSDPTMVNTGSINIEINKSAVQTLSLSDGVQVLQTEPTIKLQVNVAGAIGKTFSAKFQYDVATGLAPVKIDELSCTVRPGKGGVVIEAKEPVQCLVTDIPGRVITRQLVNGSAEISLPQGLFIVSLSNSTVRESIKIIVLQ